MPGLTTWAHSCSAVVLPMRTMSSPKGVQKQSHGCSCQGCKVTNHTFGNFPEVASGTDTSTHRNPLEPSGTRDSRNRHQHTPEPSRTFRNLHRNPPEPSGTLRNLPEPASRTYTSAPWNPPEPSGTSGTRSFDPRRRTKELIWAEDPISLRCWGKRYTVYNKLWWYPQQQ